MRCGEARVQRKLVGEVTVSHESVACVRQTEARRAEIDQISFGSEINQSAARG